MITQKNIALKTTALLLALGLTVGASTALSAPSVDNTTVSDRVQDELLYDPAVPSYKIDASTVNGIVTLTGSVDNLIAKQRAARIAAAVKGVRGVVNQIKVTPSPDISDKKLRNNVNEALLQDPATDSYEIDVKAKGGKVTLTGKVDSWPEKFLSEKVAGAVDGVTEIDNQIEVNYKTDRLDTEIKQDIEQRLHWDIFVDDALITVQVKDGKVTLTGTVGSASEKNRARMLAYVAGTNSFVIDQDLKVAKWARNKEMRKNKYVTKSDKQIREAVMDALLYDPRVYSFNVEPSVSARTVTLRGEVDNLKAKRAAAADARNVVGVSRVVNRIKVRPKSSLSDLDIESNIKSALLRDPFVESYEINVHVNGSVATLRGEVDSYFERLWAEEITSKANGVVAVLNRLDVDNNATPYTFSPFIDEFIYDYDDDYNGALTSKSDADIKEDITKELFWSPFVDKDDVKVTVNNGVATLTGIVDSWTEWSAAKENAYEGGATWVNNRLTIDFGAKTSE